MNKISRKNKKTLKRKNSKKGTKSNRKIKGGDPFFFPGCNDYINTINSKNSTIQERRIAIGKYIREKCGKIHSSTVEIGNTQYYNYLNGHNIAVTVNPDKNNNIYRLVKSSDPALPIRAQVYKDDECNKIKVDMGGTSIVSNSQLIKE